MYKAKLFHNGAYSNVSKTFWTEDEMNSHIEDNKSIFPESKGYEWKTYKIIEKEM